ncbi:MAG: proline/glycine betaine ABC transporter substrate-binding protein ProX, partial [Sphaerospermopsis sp. SIO1G2]|nr:proline/glycine betaine ABC transporter substrate-binding protein ProX [Sphaerospermopsis sp. SIO1G2]
TRYQQGQPVLYYTWTPYWMAEELKVGEDVIWLEVPYTSLPKEQGNVTAKDTTAMGKNLGFALDNVRILANKEFMSENPTAKRFFELVKLPADDISAQNKRLRNGEKSIAEIRGHAEEWIKNNQAEFDSWVEEARKVSVN